MAKKINKEIKAVLKKNSKKKTASEYDKDGSPKNWPKVLKRVPMNRNVRVKDLPKQPVFKDEGDKQRFLDQCRQGRCRADRVQWIR